MIRHFGLSLNRWEPDNGLKALHTGLIDTVQVIHNIFDQAPEDNLYPLCQELNIGVIARVPLDEGSLGGKMTLETKFPEGDWRAMYFGPKNLGATLERVEKLKKILPPGMTLPQMALRYILSFPAVSTIIVGMRKPEHVRQNIAASDAGPLDAALLQVLKAHRWDRKPEPRAGLTLEERPGSTQYAPGDRRHQQHFISILKRVLVSTQKADVFFIHVHIQEAANFPGFIPQMRFEVGKLLVERGKEF